MCSGILCPRETESSVDLPDRNALGQGAQRRAVHAFELPADPSGPPAKGCRGLRLLVRIGLAVVLGLVAVGGTVGLGGTPVATAVLLLANEVLYPRLDRA